MLIIKPYNQVYLSVSSTDRGIEQDLSDYFTFQVPGHKFMPAFKRGTWDGKIRLYNTKTKLIYAGLLDQIVQFAANNDYSIDNQAKSQLAQITPDDIVELSKHCQSTYQPRDYQISGLVQAIAHQRAVLLSPTGSGKSLIIYLLTRYYQKKTLIIVPTTGLVHQMSSDFKSYNYQDSIHLITAGQTKQTDCLVTITTWQSIFKLPEQWFEQFDVVICDEVHLAKAASLTSIMCKLTKCKYRFGFTGTLDGTPTNKIVIQGLFGPVISVTTTAKLIDSNVLSNFAVKCVVLSYPDSVRKLVKQYRYPEELEYIVTNSARNNLIAKLACSVKGNTLVLFQFVEKHGDPLQQLIRTKTDRPVYYIHGAIEGQQRELARHSIEQQDNAIIVASVQTFSTGINIKSLKNIIFASPSKSRIRTLQSIGRVLRKSDNKDQSILYDIADDLKWKTKTNFTLAHFFERLKIYNQEQFPYTVHKMELKIDV